MKNVLILSLAVLMAACATPMTAEEKAHRVANRNSILKHEPLAVVYKGNEFCETHEGPDCKLAERPKLVSEE